MFVPFQDDTASSSIEDLTLENQSDRVNLYGNLQITKDQIGLKTAKTLQNFVDALVDELEKQPLPEKISIQTTHEVDNPFL